MYYIIKPSIIETIALHQVDINDIIGESNVEDVVQYVDDNLEPLIKTINTDLQLEKAAIACDDADGIRVMWELYSTDVRKWIMPEENEAVSLERNQILVIKFDSNNEASSFRTVNEKLASLPNAELGEIIKDNNGNITYIFIKYKIIK